MKNDIIAVRGGGDIASGIIQKLHRSGFRVLVLEIGNPTSIRRTVCFSEAVFNGEAVVEDIRAVLVKGESEIFEAWDSGNIPVIVDPKGEYIEKLKPAAVVDAILAKRNLGTHMDLAPVTVAVGPGFEAGRDVHIVVESNRGHNLGRLIFKGSAEPNTGNPGSIGGYTTERVLYSPAEGIIKLYHEIGDIVEAGEAIASVDGQNIYSRINGVVRGLIREGTYVTKGFKSGDVDPRGIESLCHTISDKARAIGGAVLEAVMIGRMNK